MIVKINDVMPRNAEEWKKLILYTVKNKGYNKATFKHDFQEVCRDELALPSAVDNEYNILELYVEDLDATGSDFLTRAKEAFLNTTMADNQILLIAALCNDWLTKKRQYNMAQGRGFTAQEYKLAAYDVVSKNGYDKLFYMDQLSNALEGDNTRYTNEISNIDEWAQLEVEYNNNWHNLQPIQFDAFRVWNSNNIVSSYEKKMLGIAVKTYLYYNKLGKKRPNKEATEEFKIGDRISLIPHDFTLLESWEEDRNNAVIINKYKYEIRYNNMTFKYEGTLTPQELESCSKINATVKNINTNGNYKIVTITQARLVR